MQKIGLNTYIRIKGTIPKNWDGVGTATTAKGHIRRWSNTLNEWMMGNLLREDKIDRIIWFDSTIQDESYDNPIGIYTDASKYRDNVGYSWVATDGDYIIEEAMIPAKDMETSTAGLAAVHEALLWLKESQNTNRNSEIMTDCQSVALILNSHKAKSQLCADTLQLISFLKGRAKIIWIKGHNGTGCTADRYTLIGINVGRSMNMSLRKILFKLKRRLLSLICHVFHCPTQKNTGATNF